MNKKIVAASMAVLALGSGLIGAGLHDVLEAPETKIIELNNTVVEEVEVIKEVEVPFNVTVEKIVEVEDTDLLKAVCERALYDDLSECREEVEAEDSAIKLAIAKIKEELADEDFVEDEMVSEILEDEDEFSIVRIYNEFEDIEVLRSDFDDEEYRFEIKVKLDDEEADNKVYAIFNVKVEDGEAEVRDVTLKE